MFSYVSAERAVSQGWTAIVVTHSAGVLVRRIVTEDAVGKCWAALSVVHPAAYIIYKVAAECAVDQRGIASPIVHPTAFAIGEPCCISDERTIGNSWTVADTGDRATINRGVSIQSAVGDRGAGQVVGGQNFWRRL